jgi:branched-chain amino acid transport system ATP-binding protein
VSEAQMQASRAASPTGSDELLRVEGLVKHFPIKRGVLKHTVGQVRAVDGVDLEIVRGETLGVVGESGCGKSTMARCIMRLLDPTGGRITFDGQDITAWPPHRIARCGLGYVPEDRRVFTDLTSLENLEVGRRPPRGEGVAPWTPARLFRLFPNLAALAERAAGQISGGEQQMLSIARTLMGNPRVLLLDEPSEGLAPVILDQLARTIVELKASGLSILLCEQNLRFARAVADRALVMERGRIRFSGSMTELSREHGGGPAHATV